MPALQCARRLPQSVGEAALAESAAALEEGARRLSALDTRVRSAWDALPAASGALTAEELLQLAGMSGYLGGDGGTARGSSADEAAPNGTPGVEELAAALALTQQVRNCCALAAVRCWTAQSQATEVLHLFLWCNLQLLARQREEARHYKEEAAQLRAAAAAQASASSEPRAFQNMDLVDTLRDELTRTRVRGPRVAPHVHRRSAVSDLPRCWLAVRSRRACACGLTFSFAPRTRSLR